MPGEEVRIQARGTRETLGSSRSKEIRRRREEGIYREDERTQEGNSRIQNGTKEGYLAGRGTIYMSEETEDRVQSLLSSHHVHESDKTFQSEATLRIGNVKRFVLGSEFGPELSSIR